MEFWEDKNAWLGRAVMGSRENIAAFSFYGAHFTGPLREQLLTLLKTEKIIGWTLDGIRRQYGLGAITLEPVLPKGPLNPQTLGTLLAREQAAYREVLGRTGEGRFGAVYQILAQHLAAQQTGVLALWGQIGG